MLRPWPGAAVWLVDGPDALELEPADRERRRRAFSAWLDSLVVPIQLLVRCRHLRVATGPEPAAGSPLADRLRHDRRAHLARTLAERPAFDRQVHLVVATPDRPAAVGARAAAEGLSRIGLAVRPASAEVLTSTHPFPDEAVHYCSTGSGVAASLRVTRLPGRLVEPGWLWDLVGLEAEQDLSVFVRPRASGPALRRLERARRIVDTARLVGTDAGDDEDPRLQVGARAIQTLQRRLAADEVRAFELGLTVTLLAPSPEAVGRLVDAQLARIRGLLGDARRCTFEQARARRDTLPSGLAPAEGLRLVDTEALSTLWPWVDAGRPPEAGALLGRHRRTRALCQVDLFDTDRRPNANCGIVAASGGGKSYLAGLLALEDASRGIGSIIVDPEGEHGGLCRAAGGAYLVLGGPHTAALNVFELGEPEDGTAAAVDCVAAMCGGLSDLERARVEAAADAVQAGGRTPPPTLGDVHRVLLDRWPGDRLTVLLERWVSGRAGRCFSRAAPWPPTGPITGVSLAECPPEWVAPATVLLAAWLWAVVRRDPRPRHVVLDEAGLLLEHQVLRRLLVQLARRIRKHQGSLVFVTQNVGDLFGSVVGEVLAGNAATLLLGSQHGHDAARLQSALSLTDAQRAAIEECRRGEFLVVSGDERTPVVVQAPPLHHAILAAGRPGAA